jgi:hypothetical protein
VFTFSSGYQPTSLNGAFKRLMRDSGLLKDADGQQRSCNRAALFEIDGDYGCGEIV